MSGKIFVDSNILIYSIDNNDSVKQDIAKKIITELSDNAVISTQVLQEFYNVVTRKLNCPKDKAKQLVKNISESFYVHKNSVSDILHAIEINMKTQFSFWDSLVISAAISEGCDVLYSEDLNDGQRVEELTIKNPICIKE